jgi:hypothetical protein
MVIGLGYWTAPSKEVIVTSISKLLAIARGGVCSECVRLWLTEAYMRGHGYILAAAAAALMGGALLLGTSGAQANWKDDEAACLAEGGTPTFEQGTSACATSDPVGNCDNNQCQTIDEEESSKGHLGNRPQHDEVCTGPGQGNSTAQC